MVSGDPRLKRLFIKELKTTINTNIFQLFGHYLRCCDAFIKLRQKLTRPVNKLVLAVSRCQSDPYMKEIILLHAVSCHNQLS